MFERGRETEKEREKERKRERQRERQREREREKERGNLGGPLAPCTSGTAEWATRVARAGTGQRAAHMCTRVLVVEFLLRRVRARELTVGKGLSCRSVGGDDEGPRTDLSDGKSCRLEERVREQ